MPFQFNAMFFFANAIGKENASIYGILSRSRRWVGLALPARGMLIANFFPTAAD
jgi:hypothetical protein